MVRGQGTLVAALPPTICPADEHGILAGDQLLVTNGCDLDAWAVKCLGDVSSGTVCGTVIDLWPVSLGAKTFPLLLTRNVRPILKMVVVKLNTFYVYEHCRPIANG